MAFRFLISIAMLWTAAVAEKIQHCDGQPYYLSQYTCYNGFLCPVVQGERSLRCGNACYLKEMNSCKSGRLQQLKPVKNPFGLVVQNSIPAINGKHIHACGSVFVIGSPTCVYCPFGGCDSYANKTLLTTGGDAMQVVVPGGQQTYIAKNGAMGFTIAHSTSVPGGATIGFWQAYENGAFVNTRSSGWLACPVGKDTEFKYQLFAKLKGLVFAATCVGLNIVTDEAPQGTFGAFQYV